MVPMTLIGIDTSGPECSVALLCGEAPLAEERLETGARASRDLLPALDRLLKGVRLSLEDVDGFAAVRGPGSFTGLRVGLATARGLALATGKPAAGFNALDLLAWQVPHDSPLVCAWIDAGRAEVYTATYVYGRSGWELQGAHALQDAARAVAQAPPGIFLGSGARRYHEEIEARGAGFRVVEHRPHLALDAAHAWARQTAMDTEPDPQSLRPLYIRPSEAERTGRWRTTRTTSNA
jgi:tRNA threonylcarbamoyladenosine biosynthesis protein TsaB